MKLQQFVLFLLYSGAFGQDACSNDVEIQGEGDLGDVNGCRGFSGTMSIENTDIETLSLESREIDGEIIISNNSQLRAIVFPGLRNLSGQVRIFNNTILNSIEFPEVEEIENLTISGVPQLATINFPNLENINDLVITNTGLQELPQLPFKNINSLEISQNLQLKKIDLPELTETGSTFLIAGNEDAVVTIPKLESAGGNFTLSECGSIDLQSLSEAGSEISFSFGTFDSLFLPNLTSVQESLSITNNELLSNCTIPQLKEVGGNIVIANNTSYESLEFEALESVSGSIILAGAFEEVSFPALNSIQGQFNLQSSSKNLSCEDIQERFEEDNIVNGSFGCASDVEDPNTDEITGINDDSAAFLISPSSLLPPLVLTGLTFLFSALL